MNRKSDWIDVNFGKIIEFYAISAGDRVALEDDQLMLTYRQVSVRTAALAQHLERSGVLPGDRVAVIAPNSVGYCLLLLACLRIGAIFVPISTRLTPDDVRELTIAVEPKLMLVGKTLQENLTSVMGEWRVQSMEQALESPLGQSTARPWFDSERDDVAMLLFTSGTTGIPKGAKITHLNLWANAANVVSHQLLSSQDAAYIALPLYHSAGVMLQFLPHLYVGARSILAHEWSETHALEALQARGATTVFLLPRQWESVVSRLTMQNSSLRLGITGGERLSQETIDAVERLSLPLAFSMGMTEVSGQALFIAPEDLKSRNGTLGRPTIWSQVEVLRDDGLSAGPGEVGELSFSGPLVMTGYWGVPGLSGPFRGGDLVTRDGDGFITLVDRKKDIIRSGGETVFSAEVERVVLQYPGVIDAAIIGLPHERWGEGVTAVVVPAPGASVQLVDLQEHVTATLASFKKPVRLEIVDHLPRTVTGKVRKDELRERFREVI